MCHHYSLPLTKILATPLVTRHPLRRELGLLLGRQIRSEERSRTKISTPQFRKAYRDILRNKYNIATWKKKFNKDNDTETEPKPRLVLHSSQGGVTLCNGSCNFEHTIITFLATTKIIARQIAAVVAKSRIEFYFLQRLQQLFSALHCVTPPSATCLAIFLFGNSKFVFARDFTNIIQTFAVKQCETGNQTLPSVTSPFM